MTRYEIRLASLDRAIKVMGEGADSGRIVVVADKFDQFIREGLAK